MVVDETLVYTDNVDEHLGFDSRMHPIICQIGGWNPEYAAKATKLVQEYNYDEINLNVDCPSDRVSGKRLFGAALMKQQQTCIDMVKAMHDNATTIPISIKCRIGIDDLQDGIFLVDFIESLTPYCQTFYIHARTCWLNGLSPAQNRIVPPLNYPRVYALCRQFPNCNFVLNGGIAGLQQAQRLAHCNHDERERAYRCTLCLMSTYRMDPVWHRRRRRLLPISRAACWDVQQWRTHLSFGTWIDTFTRTRQIHVTTDDKY